jgi:hypothetical protein
MKILLSEWAKRRYDPPPSDWVLRKWVRQGEIYPAPELVGKAYYVDEKAIRQTGAPESEGLVGKLKAREAATA